MNIIQNKISEIDGLAINLYSYSINNYIINSGRRVGNTRRQVDVAIDLLFKDFTIKVEDHYREGKCKSANYLLLDIIIYRLRLENKSNKQTLIIFSDEKGEIFIKLAE